MVRAGPGSTTVTYSPTNGLPLPPPAVTQSKANGPRVGSTVRFCTPHAVDVFELKSPGYCPTHSWKGTSRSQQQSYRL